ncbi:TolC family protein [Mucilaginibacter auburnensis]|uniref:Cobalt-zinc-cadmium efflux system outer membrane protein n=1 Tax=Mucilaginibacter auburnensis TaxID=1457233 RepID=A0A2H9VQK1_9SPHI|nr:TolC family protein [Mucilaginibacter auburnensis]PJJ83080.1 cobalt-zinc-cadmium efflux system outer membrane protein [Mucilaginibacter auburnensis]
MRRIIRVIQLAVFCLFVLTANRTLAQTDTLRLSFKDAEKRFLENNFSLLAQKYNVDATKALVEQARLWDNPVLSTDQNITDNTHRYFNHSGNNGQIFVQMSQLIQTAGKRGKQIKVAEDAGRVQEAEFTDMLRNLRYNLQLDLAQAANLAGQNKIYQAEINAATELVNAVDKSYQSGNSSLKDLVRLKALLFTLQNQQIDNRRQLNDLQKELKTLLAVDPAVFIQPLIADAGPAQTLSPELLYEQAMASRGDHLANKYTLDQSNDELILQKALAKPDVTVGAAYDQNSSYARHYVGLQISLPIPLFNRNQGNIKSAQFAAKSQEMVVKNSELQLKADVYAAVQQYKLSQQLLNNTETDFYERYDNIFNAMLKSFQQRQIGLPEFIDFFDSYKETKIKILQLQLELQKSIADLNYAVGTNVVTIP